MIPADEAKEMRAAAYRAKLEWPPEILGASAMEAQRFFYFDDEIRAEFLRLALKPEPSKDEAKAIGDTISTKRLTDVLVAALAVDDDAGSADPKAAAPPSTGPGSTGDSSTGA